MDKPIVEMDDLEFVRTFDEIGSDIRKGMLESARQGEDQELRVAVVLLTLPSGETRIVTYSAEYGDKEAWVCARDLVREIRRTKSLHEGESVEAFVWDVRRVEPVVGEHDQ